MIDGTGAPARPHQDLLIRGGKIVALGPTGALGQAPDSVIDAAGLFAIPGLIDAHTHLGNAPWEQRAATLRGAIMGGVTSVLTLADDARSNGDLQRAVVAGQIQGPRVYYVALFGGPAFFSDPRVLDASRGYAPGTAPWMQSVGEGTNFAEAVTLARGTGAMGVKLYAALDSVTVARATAEAHKQGIKVIAHSAVFPGKPGDLVAAGVDMLAHTPYLVWQGSSRSDNFLVRASGDFLGVPANSPAIENLLAMMKQHGTALNPTFWVFERGAPDSLLNVRTPWMYAVTRRANELGIRIVAGTDGLYNPRTDSLPTLHHELEMMVEHGGLTPLQAITSATLNGAWACGADATSGSLVAGKVADLLLLTADPSADIRNTRAIRHVVQGGRVIR